MEPRLFPELFACSGDAARFHTEVNIKFSCVLAIGTVLLEYAALRRWSGTLLGLVFPLVCGLLALLHPGWANYPGGDCGKQQFFDSILATFTAGVCVLLQAPPTEGKAAARRLLAEVDRRLLAAVPVGLFAYLQYEWYADNRGQHPMLARDWTLGPLYFLLNASPADDWIGYALLAVAVPCLLSVVVWPNTRTALVALFTAFAWVIPAAVKALANPS